MLFTSKDSFLLFDPIAVSAGQAIYRRPLAVSSFRKLVSCVLIPQRVRSLVIASIDIMHQ
jgi:hypothetical protein